MPTLPKSKLIAVVIAVAAFLALPAAAGATLSFTKNLRQPRVFVAEDNGKGAHQIGPGRNSHVSPDGELVVFEREAKSGTAEMKLYSVATKKVTTLLANWHESFIFAWSPDSTTVAALRGPLNGPSTLIAIDVETGKQTKVASGYFNGVSFSPDSTELVYGVSPTQDYPLHSNIFRALIGGSSTPITHDHISAYPLWGPNERIVFAKQLGAKQRQYGPKNELYLMSPIGSEVKRLTHTAVPSLAQGLIPTAWSASGNQLLTEFGGQDIGYAVAVNPRSGAQRPLSKQVEFGFVGVGLSTDGSTVLGYSGVGPGTSHPKVVTIPFRGGKEKVLVKGGFEPSWGN